jgi:uncharacterized protein YbaA (DUF1428 family)
MKGKYVDGFVFVVKKKDLAAYRRMAKLGAKIWKRHGALDYKECQGDDLKPKGPEGMMPMSFTKLTKARPGETVWFSFIVYKSRKHRDAVNAKVMKDPAMNDPAWQDKPMPFDLKRMAAGGFRTVIGI